MLVDVALSTGRELVVDVHSLGVTHWVLFALHKFTLASIIVIVPSNRHHLVDVPSSFRKILPAVSTLATKLVLDNFPVLFARHAYLSKTSFL